MIDEAEEVKGKEIKEKITSSLNLSRSSSRIPLLSKIEQKDDPPSGEEAHHRPARDLLKEGERPPSSR